MPKIVNQYLNTTFVSKFAEFSIKLVVFVDNNGIVTDMVVFYLFLLLVLLMRLTPAYNPQYRGRLVEPVRVLNALSTQGYRKCDYKSRVSAEDFIVVL